jgi:hypothetical protein
MMYIERYIILFLNVVSCVENIDCFTSDFAACDTHAEGESFFAEILAFTVEIVAGAMIAAPAVNKAIVSGFFLWNF